MLLPISSSTITAPISVTGSRQSVLKKVAQLMGDTEKMVLNVYNHIMEEKEDAAKVVNDTLAI